MLVHEGQANAGHYWAYIYDPHQRCWMKYNDISVTKSSWEELVRDSFGGYRNASAYCLMYINDKKPFLIEGTGDSILPIDMSQTDSCQTPNLCFVSGVFLSSRISSVYSLLNMCVVLFAEEFDKETGQILSGMDKLPPDLKHYVKEDNELFDKEVQEWDIMQARKNQQEKLALATAAAAAAAAAASSAASTTSSSPQPMSVGSSPPENTGQSFLRGKKLWLIYSM